MRTTIEFDPDTANAVQQLRREAGIGVSQAVNDLIRRGMVAQTHRAPFVPRTHRLGISIDVSNVADALELLDGPTAR